MRNSLIHSNKIRFWHDGIQYSASVHFCSGFYSSEVVNVFIIRSALNHYHNQRWSRGHKAREAKAKDSLFEDRLSRDQKQECSRPRTQAQVFSKKEKRSSKKKVSSDLKKGYKKIFRQTSKKGVQKIYSGDLQNFHNSKIVRSSSRGQGNFWRLEASRPRSPKCVLEDSTSDDNSQRRDTTGKFINRPSNKYFWKFCRNGRWFTSLRWFSPTLIKKKIKRLRTGVQRWSRGHTTRGQEHKKIRGQGQGQPFRGQTLSRPRTGMLEAKAKDQGHKRKCSPKKKGLHKNFSGDLHKKTQNFSSSPQNFNNSKNSAVLEPRTSQFSRTWGLEAKNFKMFPRGQGRPRGLHLCWCLWTRRRYVCSNDIFDSAGNMLFAAI